MSNDEQPSLPLPHFEVYVGNIGKVYDGFNQHLAWHNFAVYTTDSKNNYGRAAGETVTLFKDGEIIKEHETDKEN